MSLERARQFTDLWSPIERRNLSVAEAAHLFRRAGFGANLSQLERASQTPLPKLLDEVFDSSSDDQLEQQSRALKGVIQAGNLPVQLPAWWLYRMMRTPRPAHEKLALFWHGHFATSAAKVNSAPMMLAQNEIIRDAAYGRFQDLVLSISRDPAMLIYLDSATNRRNNPNENYGRELLELFCLGLGNYTETDIRELARAFTGWEIQHGRFAFNQFQHDPSPKRLLGKSDIESGEQAIEWIVKQPSAAKFIAAKLYRYYVSDQAAEQVAIEGLAEKLTECALEIRPVLKTIFSSQLFYSSAAYASKIRAPVDLAVGLLRCLDATTSPVKLAGDLASLGQSVFYPPNVKGWDGGKRWINSATMIGRVNLVSEILNHAETRFSVDKEQLDRQWQIRDAESAVRQVELLWFARTLDETQRTRLVEIVDQTGKRRESRLLCAFKAAATLAEFQLG